MRDILLFMSFPSPTVESGCILSIFCHAPCLHSQHGNICFWWNIIIKALFIYYTCLIILHVLFLTTLENFSFWIERISCFYLSKWSWLGLSRPLIGLCLRDIGLLTEPKSCWSHCCRSQFWERKPRFQEIIRHQGASAYWTLLRNRPFYRATFKTSEIWLVVAGKTESVFVYFSAQSTVDFL